MPASGFARLTTLDLGYNSLGAADLAELASVATLTQLDMSGNQLRELPAELSGFGNLRALALDDNELGLDEHLRVRMMLLLVLPLVLLLVLPLVLTASPGARGRAHAGGPEPRAQQLHRAG